MGRAQRAWLAAFWLAVLAGVGVSLWPAPHVPDLWFPAADKLQHAVAFAVLFLLGRRAGYGSNRWLVCGLLGLGGAIEVGQSLTETRTAEWLDWMADAIGIGVGLAVAAWGAKTSGWSATLEQVHRG